MKQLNVKLLKKLAKQNGMFWKRYLINGNDGYNSNTFEVYDFDITSAKSIRRLKLIILKNENKLFPNVANVYVGESTKYSIEFESNEDLVEKVLKMKEN